MNFDLGEDEEMLKALAERFVADQYDMERRRAYLASDDGYSRTNWALLGELGLIAAPFAAQHGGLALDATAIATVFEALGRGLVVEPLIENVVYAGCLFADTAPADLRDRLMDGLLSGAVRLALAHIETGSRGGHLWVETQARESVLSGTKPFVPSGYGVDGYIVSARTGGSPGASDGVAFYFVEADAPGLVIASWRMTDGSVAAHLTLDGVPARPLDGGLAAHAHVAKMASLARSAEALGVMQRLFDDTIEYLRTRQQFGAPLGSFQAIQHRMVAQYTVIEQARALLSLAMVTQGTAEFSGAVMGVAAFIALNAVELGHEMIQFHGGMGVTDELIIGQGHKRLLVLSRWPEPPEVALDRFAGIAA